MNRLQLRLLGSPEVTFADEALKFRSRKVLGLFIYLAVTGQRQPRDKLVELLWPTSDPQRGMASLRNSITLRKALAPAGDFLTAERGYVGLDRSQPLDVDLLHLRSVAGALVNGDGMSHSSLTDVNDLIGSYRGDFLEGFELRDAPGYEAWIREERASTVQYWSLLYSAVSQYQLDAGNGHAALDMASRWAAIEPYSESAYLHQMKAHTLNGDQSAALRVYKQLEQMLAEEFSVEPSAESTTFVEQMSGGNHAVRPHRVQHPVTEQASSHLRLQIPFVGRGVELKKLQTCYQEAALGNPHVALLVGEAGQGKSSLATTLLNWASLQPGQPDIVRANAFEMGGSLPYQPLIDGMRIRLEAENAPDDLLDDIWLAELSQLLPELRGRYPDLPQPMAGSPDFVRARLFEAMATLGIALGAKRPFIFYIDDLQWADAGTLDMLVYLIQRFTAVRLPMLFLITVRQAGVLNQPVLREWIQQVARADVLVQIDLGPLPEFALQQLFSQLAHQFNLLSDEAKELGRWLHEQTAGSPFHMVALLQMLLEQELLTGEKQQDEEFVSDLVTTLDKIREVDRLPLPPTVREIVLRRLHQLTENAHSLLLAAAAFGRSCTYEQLCQTMDLEPFAGLPALEELLAARLLVEEADRDRPISITHDNIRDIVYADASVTKKRIYHHQIFASLKHEDAPAAELAFHANAANLREPACNYAIIAGDEALAVHAFINAVTFYEQALVWADRVSLSVEKECHLCIQYGRALELAGRYPDALDHYQERHEAALLSGNKQLELAMLIAQGTIYSVANELSDFELGERTSTQALALAELLQDRSAQAKIQWNLLNVYRMLGRNEEALAAGEASLRLATAINSREQMAYAANDLVYVYMALGNIHRTVEMEELATTLWRELGNQPMLTDSLVNLAGTMSSMGAFDEALAIAQEPLAISQALDNKWAQSYGYFPLIFVYRQTLHVQDCIESIDSAVGLAQEAGFTGAQTILGSMKSLVLASIGARSLARSNAETAREIAKKHIPLFEPMAIGAQILLALAEDDLETAEALASLLDVDGIKFDAMNYFVPELAVGHLAIAQGRPAFAENLSLALLTLFDTQDMMSYLPEFSYIRGLALTRLERQKEAQAVLYQGLETLRQTGARLWHLEISSLLIDLASEAGNDAVIDELCREARVIFNSVRQQIPKGTLRDSYLLSPTVVQLFGLPPT